MTDERPWAGRRLHFIGIGGIGMSGLALVARALGAAVSGSDRAESPRWSACARPAARRSSGHAADNVPDGAEVVFSTAVPEDNPERAIARERGQRELHRADLLAEITALRRCIAITGTHGKTTTSSMVVHALRGCGLTRATSSAGRCARPARTPVGARGSGSSSRPTSPTARC